MHMADALVAPAVAATMYACSAVAAGYSVKKVKLVDDPKRIPVMGVMGALCGLFDNDRRTSDTMPVIC